MVYSISLVKSALGRLQGRLATELMQENELERLATILLSNLVAQADTSEDRQFNNCSKAIKMQDLSIRAVRAELSQNEFQDRCLKPLGHPSKLITSVA